MAPAVAGLVQPYGAYRHLPDQGHEQGLEEQGEPRPLPRPGHGHLMHAMFRTLHPRYPGMEISCMLEEIQVPPSVLHRVMDGALLTTDRAREPAATRKVDVQVQPLLLHRKGHAVHQPRRNQPQSEEEQLFLDHHQPLLGYDHAQNSTSYPFKTAGNHFDLTSGRHHELYNGLPEGGKVSRRCSGS